MKIQLTAQPATGAIDPVCGMTVDPNNAAGQYAWQGTTYYFCNPGCLAKFKADPEKYLAPPEARAFVEDGVAQLADTGVQRVVGLVLAPHWSGFSVGQYHARAGAAAAGSSAEDHPVG